MDLPFSLLESKLPDMLFVDALGFAAADPWGDVLTAAALKMGISGLFIHGPVRAAEAKVAMGFPAFCHALSIKINATAQSG